MMTFRSIPYACLILLGVAARADISSFDEANRLYEQGKYREAISAYDRLVDSGTRSAAVWFNLGNAQFKAGHVGDAIVAYRRAERLAPRDLDVRANLEFARRQVAGPTHQPGWWQRQLGWLTLNEWTLLATVPVWVWFGLMIVGQVSSLRLTSLRRGLWFSGAVSLLTLAILTYVASQRLSERGLVVTSRDTVVRAGPFDESPSAFSAADGAEFVLQDAKNDWYQVADGAKSLGWLKTNAVVAVP